LPEFGTNGTRIESCRVDPTGGRSGDDCGHRYVLRVANLHDGLAGYANSDRAATTQRRRRRLTLKPRTGCAMRRYRSAC
jgi:hypothetical protein